MNPSYPSAPLQTVLAHRELQSVDGLSLSITIGVPVYVDGWNWVCPFRIDGLAQEVKGCTFGTDEAQALERVAATLRRKLELAGVAVHWQEEAFTPAALTYDRATHEADVAQVLLESNSPSSSALGGLKQVGGTVIQERHSASCHCGAVQLELDLPNGIVNARRCDCSICRRKGAIVGSVPTHALRVIQGAEHLKLYQFNTRVAKHYFCGNCGIYTHHQRRSSPNEFGYNIGCLDGVNPSLIANVPTYDGVHHPADR